jgi:hypothetical protein
MRSVLLLLPAVALGVACGSSKLQQNAAPSTPAQTETSVTATPPPIAPVDDLKGEKQPPPEFAGIDFKNFRYPTDVGGTIKLKDGKAEYANKESGGGDTFEFHGASYVDLEGDGKPEAVVGLTVVSCGVSCDGPASLFYFFASENRRPKLLTHLETGSPAYDCGLKSFSMAGKELTLELFRSCSFDDTAFEVKEMDETEGKFIAKTFTRFELTFHQNAFVEKSRKVQPYMPRDVKNFIPTITITGFKN